MAPGRATGTGFDAGGDTGGCRPTSVCALVCAVVLVLLTPLALASPADPLWVAGLYDGADYDDTVVTLVSASWLVGAAIAAERPDDSLVEPVLLLLPCGGTAALCSPVSPRAPPSPAFSLTNGSSHLAQHGRPRLLACGAREGRHPGR